MPIHLNGHHAAAGVLIITPETPQPSRATNTTAADWVAVQRPRRAAGLYSVWGQDGHGHAYQCHICTAKSRLGQWPTAHAAERAARVHYLIAHDPTLEGLLTKEGGLS